MSHSSLDKIVRQAEKLREELLRYARRLTFQREDAEDIVQEVYTQLIVSWPQLRDTRKLRQWMRTTLKHRFIARKRTLKEQMYARLADLNSVLDAREASLPEVVSGKLDFE